MKPLRIGTRGSALALWQANTVRDRLRQHGTEAELVVITTTGDRVLDRRLDSAGGKGAFLKEIEEAMLALQIDLAVHSLKDVPTALPEGLRLCAFLERGDPRDALLSASGAGLAQLPQGAVVGTTSLRRTALLMSQRPDLKVVDLRGNVDTRIRRLELRHFDAIVLAMAGLERLGRSGEVAEVLDPYTFLPAPGQGVITLECRVGDADVAAAVAPLHHEPTGRVATTERTLLAALQGGCNAPLGAWAREHDGAIHLSAFVGRVDGTLLRRDARGREPVGLGRQLADELHSAGAREMLRA